MLYAWHTAALAHIARHGSMQGFGLDMHLDEPRCGWFATRVVHKGPLVPGAIWMHQALDEDGELLEPEDYRCEIAGDVRNALQEWPYLSGRPIPEGEYRYMHDMMKWTKAHKPEHPLANPRRSINAADVPLQF